MATITRYGITSGFAAPRVSFLFRIPMYYQSILILLYSCRKLKIFLWVLIFVSTYERKTCNAVRCGRVSLHPEYIINASCFLRQNLNCEEANFSPNYEHTYHYSAWAWMCKKSYKWTKLRRRFPKFATRPLTTLLWGENISTSVYLTNGLSRNQI